MDESVLNNVSLIFLCLSDDPCENSAIPAIDVNIFLIWQCLFKTIFYDL